MKTNWERFLTWRGIWRMNNMSSEGLGMNCNVPKQIALKEMMGYLVKSDREVNNA